MKGLLKGLRYISQIFVADAKEPEIQIGAPTDVKHVAHIGWDNASVTNPSWMNEFKAQPGASASGGAEGAGAEPPSLPGGGGDGAGAGKAEKPRRTTKGKGSGGGEVKRRDGPEGSRRPAKAEEGCEGEASGAAAPKQRRRKPKTSSGRSKSSSGGAASEPSAAAAED